ncbi:hypothetical protein OSJ12_22170, partial [Mycobacterium ulcerans]
GSGIAGGDGGAAGLIGTGGTGGAALARPPMTAAAAPVGRAGGYPVPAGPAVTVDLAWVSWVDTAGTAATPACCSPVRDLEDLAVPARKPLVTAALAATPC